MVSCNGLFWARRWRTAIACSARLVFFFEQRQKRVLQHRARARDIRRARLKAIRATTPAPRLSIAVVRGLLWSATRVPGVPYAIDWFRYDNVGDAENAIAIVSLLLRRGAKLDGCWGGRSAEECLRHVEDPSTFPEYEGAYPVTDLPIKTKAQFIACKKLIADERRRRYMLPRRAFLRLRSLALRGRAKPDALLAAVARLPNEMAWHVLSFWQAEADVAPPPTPSPQPPPPIISDEALLSELDGLVQAQKANSR